MVNTAMANDESRKYTDIIDNSHLADDSKGSIPCRKWTHQKETSHRSEEEMKDECVEAKTKHKK